MAAQPPVAGPPVAGQPPPTAPLLSLELPSQDPEWGTYAQYSVLRPIIIVERLQEVHFISVCFELEVVIPGNDERSLTRVGCCNFDLSCYTRPSTHPHFFKYVRLCYSHDLGEKFGAKPMRGTQRAIKVTDSRAKGVALVATGGGPPPSANMTLTLSWNKTIQVEKEVDSWGVDAHVGAYSPALVASGRNV